MFGLNVFNSEGALGIDASFQNFTLRAKYVLGSVTTKGHYYNTTSYIISTGIPFSDIVTAAVTFPAKDVPIMCVVTSDSSNNAVIAVYTNAVDIDSIYVYAFTMVNPSPESGKYGINVFNPAGTLVFSSLRKYLRIIAIDPAQYTVFPNSSTNTFAICMAGMNGHYNQDGYGDYPNQQMAWSLGIEAYSYSSNKGFVMSRAVGYSGLFKPDAKHRKPIDNHYVGNSVLVIDVTNF